ncbi:MAG TPA: discoidin domain-containing protein, partial [Jatrophihabitans sp.]|nr:discoidin domain-containing protein [Jatrophihabitans sp.]
LHYRSGGQTGTVTRDIPVRLGVLPHAGMTATADSAQSGNEAAKAIDDDPTTIWHSQWDPYQPLPHEITLDLGANYDVSGLLYLPRQDNNGNGNITSYTISVSPDGQNFTQVAVGDWPGNPAQKSAAFADRTARYVRLQALAGGGNFASAAEINILGTPAEGSSRSSHVP